METNFVQIDLAWAAGFFDGEGWSGLNQGRWPITSVSQIEKKILIRFRDSVRLGDVSSYRRSSDLKQIFKWQVRGFEKVQQVCILLWPYLSNTKRNQFKETLLIARSFPVRKLKDYPHGHYMRYQSRRFKCRCNLCRDAWAMYQALWREKAMVINDR